MTDIVNPSFFARIGLAFSFFFRVLFDAALAGRVQKLSTNAPALSEPAAAPPEPAAPIKPARALHEAPCESALQLLGLLQRKGRLVDFLMEDMSDYGDADVGAAARAVHDECRKALTELLNLERIIAEDEGNSVTVQAGFNPADVQLVGRVSGKAPFNGTLNHAGWRAASITLPKLSDSHDVHVLAPAEVEL